MSLAWQLNVRNLFELYELRNAKDGEDSDINKL